MATLLEKKVALLDRMLAAGKIEQARYDAAIQKLSDKAAKKDNFVKNKDKMTKAELQGVIDSLL